MKIIPVYSRKFDHSEIINLKNVISSGWVSSGGYYSNKLILDFSNYINQDYVSLVSSGTAALETAFAGINLKKGDEVIIPNFTIISCLNAVLKFGAKPVLVDVDRNTWLMNIKEVKQSITKKTKAILAVNIFGNPVNINSLRKLNKNKKIYIIEDCAESVGSKINNKIAGSKSDISIFSFFTNKLITSGEGGAICTSNKLIFKRVEDYKNLFFGKKERFNHREIGYNYRFTNLQAAIAYSSMKKINKNINILKKNGQLYFKLLSKNKNIIFQETNENALKIWWMYPIVFKNLKLNINKIRSHLLKKSIDTRNLFKPLDTMSFLKKYDYQSTGNINSNFLYKNGLYLPSGLDLTNKQINYICEEVNDLTG